MENEYGLLDFPAIVASKEEVSAVGKLNSKYRREAQRLAKPDHCILCGEKQSSYCNSHSVPRSCLERIARDGEVLSSTAAIGTNLVASRVGLSRAGTFHIICRDCDKEFFKGYEDSSALETRPTQRVLGQIATKCCLSELAQAIEDHKMYDAMLDEHPILYLAASSQAREISSHDDRANLDEAILAAKTGNRAFKVLWYEKLEYTTPVAFQVSVSPVVDLCGNIINNLFSPEMSYRIEPIYLCCLPMSFGTVVLAFRHRRATRLASLDEQFAALRYDERLTAILRLALAYSEKAFFSPELEDVLKETSGFKDICSMNVGSLGVLPRRGTAQTSLVGIAKAGRARYSLSTLPEIPNLLSPEYALDNVSTPGA